MSGHSKWATTKYRKGAQDKARAKVFAKGIRAIEVAAREGGGDLDANATLRTAFQKARAASVPLDTIEKAIKRGIGRPRGRALRIDQVRGLRPGRRRHHGRDAERTTAIAPAPRCATSSPATAATWPSRARSRGSSSARGS